jgi:hypothetical protein
VHKGQLSAERLHTLENGHREMGYTGVTPSIVRAGYR